MGILTRVKNFVFQQGYDDDYYYEEVEEQQGDEAFDRKDDIPYIDSRRSYERSADAKKSDTIELPSRATAKASGKDAVYALPGAANMQIVISTPADIDAASAVCDLLKQHKTVIVNMENVEMKDAQRIMDFLSGVTYAINGDIQSISNRIYIVAPETVEVSEHFKEHLKAQGLFSGFGLKASYGGR
ncbi:MAG: cell division protein SepF [Defluviitaleaceae bacterium]|nr:cell division protein SepF [Defluviitaleaceae bacterium]